MFSIYILGDLGVLSNLIGSLSLANEHYSPPTEWIMCKPYKNKVAGVNSRFASVSESELKNTRRCSTWEHKEGHEIWSERFYTFKDSVNSFSNSRMLCTACTFSTHELRGQLNRFLMVSFWKCCRDHFLCIYWNNYSSQSQWIVAEYLPRFQGIIVK